MTFSRAPLVKWIAPLMGGIWTWDLAGNAPYWTLYFVLPIVPCLFYWAYSKANRFSDTPFFGFSVWLILFLGSWWWAGFYSSADSRLPENKFLWVKAILEDTPELKSGRYRATAEVFEYVAPDDSAHVRSRVLLYFQPDVPCSDWAAGDELWLQCKFLPIRTPMNPGEFNMERHYRFKGIFSRAYVSAHHVIRHKPVTGFSFARFFSDVRESLSARIDAVFRSPREAGLGKALVFGYKSELDEETVQAFSRSGTSHVLAVSGLHVGIIWLMMDRLLYPLSRTRRLRWIKFSVSLVFLWFYALLTGMSPSVARAAFMFSFMALATVAGKRYNSLNILAFSAIILLLFHPPVLFSPGFQLSYAAVAGILVMYPLINGAFYFPQKIRSGLWAMTALTLAAQIATTPITLYWFGSFPTWFAFSNLLIVPLSGMALYAGVAGLILASVPHLGALLMHLFQLFIKVMLSLAEFFSDLPNAVIAFSFSLSEGIMAVGSLLFAILFFQRKRFVYFAFFVLLLMSMVGFRINREWQWKHREAWVVYPLKKGAMFRYVNGRTAYDYATPGFDSSSYRFSVLPSDQSWGIRKKIPLSDVNGLVSVPGFRLVVLEKRHLISSSFSPVMCNAVVPGPDLAFLDVEKLLNRFRFNYMLLTAETPRKRREKWTSICREWGIPVYDLTQTGWKEFFP
jgi:competence protein ComEC